MANKLAEILDEPEKKNIWAYGAEIILGAFIKFALFMVFSILLDVFPTALVIIASSAVFRVISGGVHFSTYYRCLTISLVTFISLGLLVENLVAFISSQQFLLLCLLVLIFLVFVILKWVPAPNENRVITCPKRINKFKNYSLLLVSSITIGLLGLTYFFVDYQNLKFLLAILVGFFWQGLTITPLAYRIFHKIDLILDKAMLKGGKENAKENC